MVIKSLYGLAKFFELEYLKTLGDIVNYKMTEELIPHVDQEGLNYVSKISIAVTPKAVAKNIKVNIGFTKPKES